MYHLKKRICQWLIKHFSKMLAKHRARASYESGQLGRPTIPTARFVFRTPPSQKSRLLDADLRALHGWASVGASRLEKTPSLHQG